MYNVVSSMSFYLCLLNLVLTVVFAFVVPSLAAAGLTLTCALLLFGCMLFFDRADGVNTVRRWDMHVDGDNDYNQEEPASVDAADVQKGGE